MSIKVTLSVTSGTTNIALSVQESECLNGSSSEDDQIVRFDGQRGDELLG
jgi:hypothetical protein